MATDSNKPFETSQGTSAGEAAKEVAHEASSQAKGLGREAADEVRSTMEYVREQARTSLDEGKNQVASQVGGLAKALHRSSEELRKDELGRLAEQSEWIAGRIEEFQDYLRDRETRELLNDVREVARSQPGWFLGGMFAAGLVAARFLHSGRDDGGGERNRGGSAGYDYSTADTARR